MQPKADLPDGLDALNRYRNGWSTDHNTRRPKLREFEGVPTLRRRRRNRPPVLANARPREI